MHNFTNSFSLEEKTQFAYFVSDCILFFVSEYAGIAGKQENGVEDEEKGSNEKAGTRSARTNEPSSFSRVIQGGIHQRVLSQII